MLAELSLLPNIRIQSAIMFRSIYSFYVITRIYYAFIYHIISYLLYVLFIYYKTGFNNTDLQALRQLIIYRILSE